MPLRASLRAGVARSAFTSRKQQVVSLRRGNPIVSLFDITVRDERSPTNCNGRRPISSLTKEAATQPADYDPKRRWLSVPPANLVHLSCGSVYVYSMWTPGMTHNLGIVSSAASDWTHSEVLPVFSAAAVSLGLTTAFLGRWVEKVGPRTSGFVGSIFWGSGLVTTGLGVHLHSLPVVYMGYGLLGGIGWVSATMVVHCSATF
jgi:hypothetical protein